MELIICDKDYKKIGIIDASDVLWTTRYYDVGDFELHIPLLDEYLNILVEENYVFRSSNKQFALIEKINIKNNIDNSSEIVVSGRFVECLLERRIIWSQTQINGLLESGIRNLISDNFIVPTLPFRKMSEIKLGTYKGYNEKINTQYTGDNVLMVIKDICKSYGLGFKFIFDDKNFYFELYKGINRSKSQKELPFVAFSDEFDNLLSSEYQYDVSNYKNSALVAGEGEGLDRKTQSINDNISGISRREIFVDARDLSSNSDNVSNMEYSATLLQRGNEALVEFSNIENFTSQIDEVGNFKYDIDYKIGDIVTIYDSRINKMADKRIVEIIECEDEKGYRVSPTFE